MSDSSSRFHFPLEVLQCPWSELESYCAANKVFLLSQDVELLFVAQAVAQDQLVLIEELLLQKKMHLASKEELEPNIGCSFVIVQPYIFVREPA